MAGKELDIGVRGIKSITVVEDQGGDFLDIMFWNGATLRVAPENDAVIYFPMGDEEEAPNVKLLVDLDGGHHAENPFIAFVSKENGGKAAAYKQMRLELF